MCIIVLKLCFLKFHLAYSSSGPFYNTMSFMMTSLKHYFLSSAEELLSDDVLSPKKGGLKSKNLFFCFITLFLFCFFFLFLGKFQDVIQYLHLYHF